MKKLEDVLAENIVTCRKKLGLTQLELAEKINYSDKAVSKWERGESVPDIFVLKSLADLFGVSVDDLLSPQKNIRPKPALKDIFVKYKKLLIAIASTTIVWILAVCLYVFPNLFGTGAVWPKLAFIYALPISFIVLLVFACIWGKYYLKCIMASGLLWTLALAIYLTLRTVQNIWLVFLICVPVQAGLILLFSILGIRNLKKAQKEVDLEK